MTPYLVKGGMNMTTRKAIESVKMANEELNKVIELDNSHDGAVLALNFIYK